MAKIIKAKLILERRQASDSIKDIANKYHVAKKSIITVCNSESTDATLLALELAGRDVY